MVEDGNSEHICFLRAQVILSHHRTLVRDIYHLFFLYKKCKHVFLRDIMNEVLYQRSYFYF